METGKPDEAAANFETAVMLSPTNALALDGLGAAQAAAGRNDKAALSLAKAVALAPTNSFIRLHFGMALQNQGRVAQAAEQYRTAISLDAKSAAALNNLAWLLATSTEATNRNGAEAVEFARRACEQTENREPLFIGTLAAAFAEAGRFPEAIASAEKARELAKAAGLEGVARRNTELLELYRDGKPFRDSPVGAAIDTK